MKMTKDQYIESIKNKLIISCQAFDDEILNNVKALTLIARSVVEGGAEFLRLCQVNHIKSIKKNVNVPLMGLIKKDYLNSEVCITPTCKDIDKLAKTNIECIAIDATNRIRPKESLEDMVIYTRNKYPNVVLMADCSSIEDVLNANELGFDLIGTTLRGNTDETKSFPKAGNDFDFIKECISKSNIPIIAEGGIWEPLQVKKLLELGCHSVVVGSAITRPKEITQKFLKSLT